MVGVFELALENASLANLAKSWGVSSEQAARRVRQLPFFVLTHDSPQTSGRGRPGRRLALALNWRFWEHAGKRPLGNLVEELRTLHRFGEPFAVGVPFTSGFWRPFLHPEVRLLAPPRTYSLWKRLFEGGNDRLTLLVDLLPESAKTVDLEGLPVLDRPHAIVDALMEFGRLPNMNVLALADWLAHRTPDLALAEPYAAKHGLDRDFEFLEDHRRRKGLRAFRPREARRAHRLAEEMSRVPATTKFEELLSREAMKRD